LCGGFIKAEARSCSHAGICNVLTSAQTTYDRPIHMVVGGLHLVPTQQQPVKETVDFLSRRLQPTPQYILPLHCTGLEPRAMIRQAMGDAVVPAGVGMKVVVNGKDDQLDEVELKILD
jgi:7,8-dihydropterin-6-yl-methyl-4-(beta-D-ribofuranosyl)aminobenzene 5'-phosphate synthase